jgi:lysyl-tRNA synthetase class 2
MNSSTGLRFLRPCLNVELTATTKAAYGRFYTSTARCLAPKKGKLIDEELKTGKAFRTAVQERINELEAGGALKYPRIKTRRIEASISDLKVKYAKLQPGQHVEADQLVYQARVMSVRIASKGLVFVDLMQNSALLQVVLSKDRIEGASEEEFIKFYHLLRRGDVICEFICIGEAFQADKCSYIWPSVCHTKRTAINSRC